MTQGHSTQPGPLSDEATKLFQAAHDWVGERIGKVGEHVAVGSTECHLCPVCQLIGLVRAVHPEVVEHLADASASLLAALRTLVETHERQWSEQRTRRGGSGVEHIDIG